MSAWWWLLVPVVVGAVQPVIWQMNVRVAKHTGDMESAVLLHVVGVVVGLMWIAGGLRGAGEGGLGAIPWWAWAAGAIGVTGMAAMTRAIPVMGVAVALTVVVAAQLIASLVFEHYGWMGAVVKEATPERWVGALLLVAGAFLINR